MKYYSFVMLFALASAKRSADEEEASEAKADHPPKEVSPYTQEMVREEFKSHFWPDHAKPTDPAYHDQDTAPVSHPMGFSDAQMKRQGLSQWWTSGNGQGSEKHDAYWEIAHDTGATPEFHHHSRQPWIPSDNKADSEPHVNSVGWSVAQKRNKWMPSPNPYGFEKADTFWTFGHETPNRDAFDHKSAREVFIPSDNHSDPEATHHPLGFDTTQVKHRHHHKKHRHSKNLAQLGFWGNGNGSGSEKQDGWWDIGHATKSSEAFDNQAAWSVFIPSDNKGDSTPSVGPNNWSQVQLGSNKQWWWHQEGLEAKDTKDFYDKASKPALPNYNSGDPEPAEEAH